MFIYFIIRFIIEIENALLFFISFYYFFLVKNVITCTKVIAIFWNRKINLAKQSPDRSWMIVAEEEHAGARSLCHRVTSLDHLPNIWQGKRTVVVATRANFTYDAENYENWQ